MNKSRIAREPEPKQKGHIRQLLEKLNSFAGGEAKLKMSPSCPDKDLEASLEDAIAFESLESGLSLFEGLQLHGMELPPPEKLDELQSQHKAMEILKALADLRVFLIGFDGMSGRALYATLWNQTLWEGCYVLKRHPGSITLIDVSHKMKKAEMQQYLDSLIQAGTIH